MATLLLAGAGAAFGSLPGGVSILTGLAIGATAGGWIDQANMPRGEYGKLADRRFAGSSYGAGIARVWGHGRVGGNISWVAQDQDGNHLVEHEESSGGGGGRTLGNLGGGGGADTFWYSATFAAKFCKGDQVMPNEDIVSRNHVLKKLKLNDQVVWDADKPSDENIFQEGTHFVFFEGSESQSPSSDIVAHSGLSSDQVVAFRGDVYVIFLDISLKDYGNAIPTAIEADVETDEVDLADVVSDLCRSGGLLPSQIDATALTGIPVRGFVLTDSSGPIEDITRLCEFFAVDVVEADGEVIFVPRGGAISRTIDEDDLGATDGDPGSRLTSVHANYRDLPGRFEVSYMDWDNALQTGHQADVRQSGNSLNVQSTSVPLVLTASEAKAGAQRALDSIWLGADSYSFTLPYKYGTIIPSDVLSLPVKDGFARVRVTSVDRMPKGEMRIAAVRDGATAYTQLGGGSTGGGIESPPPSPIPTVFRVWSGTEIVPEHRDQAGFYVAASGIMGWRGGRVYYSLDEMEWFPAQSVTKKSAFGVTTTVLDDTGAVAGVVDPANTVEVNVSASYADLYGASAAAIAAGQNHALVGEEILAISTVTPVVANVFELSDLLRGELGTPMGSHSIGELFVLLSPAVVRVTVPDCFIGETVYVRVVSAYQVIGDVASQSCVIAERTPTEAEELQEPSYITLSANANLANERILTAGAGIHLSDGGAGGNLVVRAAGGHVVVTANTTLSASDSVVIVNHTAAVRITLPLVANCVPGQRFHIVDASASGASTYSIRFNPSSGEQLEGVADQIFYITHNHGWVEIECDGTGFKILESRGTTFDVPYASAIIERLNFLSQRGNTVETLTLPTSGNTHVGFIPFQVPHRCKITNIYLCGGNSTPTTGSAARMQTAIYATDTSTFDPTGSPLWNQTFTIVGTGSPTIQTGSGYDWIFCIGSIQTWTTDMVCAAPIILNPGVVYHFAVQFESTFTAGNMFAMVRNAGLQTKRLSAGTQSFPWTWGTSPSMSIRFGGEQQAAPDMYFKLLPV